MADPMGQTIHRDPALLYVEVIPRALIPATRLTLLYSYWILFPISVVMVCLIRNTHLNPIL